jgi:hypothetical protein
MRCSHCGGTSRMPAREALLRLTNERYLVGTTRGFVTPRLSLEDIRDIFAVRLLLEPRAAANAAEETQHDFDFPQREAAFFYGLFLRGHSAEELKLIVSSSRGLGHLPQNLQPRYPLQNIFARQQPFAAGHRPCFFCRRDDANRFRAAWEAGNGVENARARDIDTVLHRERLDRGRKRLHPLPMPPGQLPEGTMLQVGDASHLVARGRMLRWSFEGYAPTGIDGAAATLLTPPSTVRAFQTGYRPVLHPSANV